MAHSDREFSPFEPPPGRRRASQTGLGSYLLALLIGFGLGAFLLWAASHFLIRDNRPPVTNPNAEARAAAPKTSLDPEEAEGNRIFKEASPSVVNVDTVLFRRGWDRRVLEEQTGTGSGFVWDTDGRVVTNFHVVQNAAQRGAGIRIVMPDHTMYDASIVGVAPDYDLAVLQIAAPKDALHPIKIGSSADLEVGQKVFAIGNPFGLSLTMTKGIISAVDRTIDSPTGTPITGAIQIDAAINPGNSGGPLLDKDGRVIGINQSITTPSGGNVGIGFAIPIDLVNQKTTDLIRHGKIMTPDLGVKLYDEHLLRREGKRFAKGVMIESVMPNGPAARADLRGIQFDAATGHGVPGDLILAINGEKVNNIADYKRILKSLKISDTAKLHIRRGDREQDAEVLVQGV